jgi:HAD superfamily hydrolase (TIGR01490 family)
MHPALRGDMKAAFFDVDGTLTKHRVWNGLMDYFTVNRVRLLTHLVFLGIHYFIYALFRLKLISQVEFRRPWAEHLSWYLRGYTEEQVDEIWDWVVTERIKYQFRQETLDILQKHKQAGDLVFLISGGPAGLLGRIAEEVKADFVIGTVHEIRDGRYTGRAGGQACQGENKSRFAREFISKEGLVVDFQASYAYADSFGDIFLLEMVGNPVVVYPDDALRIEAEKRDWDIFPK